MEVTDMTELEMPKTAPKDPTGLNIHDYTGTSVFEQAAEKAKVAIDQSVQVATPVTRPGGLPTGYLSYSQIDLFLKCPLAYYLRYHKRHRPPGDKMAAEFGKLLHKVLELTHQWVVDQKYRGPFPTEEMFAYLKKMWSDPENGMVGAHPDYWMDARDILRLYAQKNALIDHIDILAVELGDANDEEGNPIPNAIIGGVPIVAKIDLVLRDDETTVRIRDYKSDRMLRYKDEVDKDLQLGIYEIVARQTYPWAKEVVLELFMLRHGVVQQSEMRSSERRLDVEAFVQEVAHQIMTETEWKPHLNGLCHWCEYKTECPAYGEALEGGTSEAAILARDLVQIGDDRGKFSEMFGLRDQYSSRGRILDRRRKNFDKALTAFLDNVPGKDVTIGDREFYVLAQRWTEYPDRLPVVELISKRLGVPEGFVDALICKVQKSSIDEAMKSLLTGKTLGDVFEFSGERAAHVANKAYIEMLKLELESIAQISHRTRLVSRKSKNSKTTRAKKEAEATPIAMVSDTLVEEAKNAAKTAYVLKGEEAKKIEEIPIAEPVIERTPVNSSHLQSVGYEPETKMMEIEFNDRGVYRFFGVPSEIYKSLLSAPSKGTYFSAHIRTAFRYERSEQVGHDRPAETEPQRVDPAWEEVADQGVKPAAAVSFQGTDGDYIAPAVAIAMFNKATPTAQALTRPGVVKTPGPVQAAAPNPSPPAEAQEAPPALPVATAPPLHPEAPPMTTAPPSGATAPAGHRPTKKRNPMSQETKDKISAKAKARWAKKKTEDPT